MSKMKEICAELNGVWNRIGGDILTVREEMGLTDPMPRSEVADVVLDHMGNNHGVSPETIAYIDALDFEEKLKQIEACFPFEVYGW